MNNQLELDKYEPTGIEILLQNTRAHSPDGWRELSKSLIELSDDDRLLIANASRLRAEVLRLRSGMRDILDDFETTKTDMWSIIKRIQELIE